jgi:ABC-type branched-subunit amino acid transport system substrate-binding protein
MTLIILFGASNPDFEGMAEARQKFASTGRGDITVVALQDAAKSDYLKGVQLAAEQINDSPDKLLGRKIDIRIEQDGTNFENSKSTIRRVVADPSVVAVLGHRSSSVAIPASVIYEKSQMLFLPSFATGNSLTGHNFQYVFRMAPNNEVMAKQLASLAKLLGYKKIVILYARNDLSRELAFLFEEASLTQGIQLIKRSSFFESNENYRSVISHFTNDPFDAVFLASSGKAAARMAIQLREMGIDKPILGSDSLSSQSYGEIAKEAADKTIVPSLYLANAANQRNQAFIKAYEDKYYDKPDYNAAMGYDSLMLLVNTIKHARSTSPALLSSSLRFMSAWVGQTGIHAFDTSGELLGKKYHFKTWRSGELVDLPAVHVNYLLKRFEASIATEQDTAKKITNFSEQLSQRMHEDDHNLYLLDLAHEILHFKSIGVIFENTEVGRKLSGYDLLESLAKRKGVKVVKCEIAFSLLTPQEIEKNMVSCYGKLSLNSEAMFITKPRGISKELAKKLNLGLTFFKIPTIALGDRNEDLNVTLVLKKRSDINSTNVTAFSGLLNGQKVHEFSDKLTGLPELSVNLENLQLFGLPDAPILNLSPENYLHVENSLIGSPQSL